MDITNYRNAFVNLALPLFLLSEPLPSNKHFDKEYDPVAMGPVKAIPSGEDGLAKIYIQVNLFNYYSGFTVWDKLEVEGPCTIKQLIETLKQRYQVKLSMLFFEKFVVYTQYSKDQEEMDKRLPLEIALNSNILFLLD
jgi:ubiquitin-activating enzyme E1